MNEEKKEQIIQNPDDFEDIGTDGPTGQQQSTQHTYTLTLPSPNLFAGTWIAQVRSGNIVQSGWTISINPSNYQARSSVSITATEPSGRAPAGTYRIVFSGRDDQDTARSISSPSFTIAAHGAWSNLSGGDTLVGTWRATVPTVRAQSTTRFQVVNSTGVVQTGWTITTSPSFIVNVRTITVTATPPSGVTSGQFRLRITGSVRNLRGSVTINLTEDSSLIALAPSATATWSNVFYNDSTGKLIGTLTFNQNVTGIAASDFEILNDSDTAQTDWFLDTPPTTATSGTGIIITATPPSNTNASFKIRLKATSVFGPGATTANSPASAVTTSATAINNVGNTLVAGTRWGISTTVIPTTITPQGLASDGNKIWIQTNNNNGREIKRFTLTGTYEAAGDITLPLPAAPPGSTSSTPTNIYSLAYLNNKFYVLMQWAPASVYSFERYSSSFVYESRIWNTSGTTSRYGSIDITSTRIYVTDTAHNNIATSNHTFTSGTTSIRVSSAPNAIIASESLGRVYSIYDDIARSRNLTLSFASTRTDFVLPERLGQPRASGFGGSTVYIVGNDTTANNWSVYPFAEPVAVLTATWSNVSFGGNRLGGSLTFSGGNASGISASDFEVLTDANAPTTGWTINTPPTTASNNTRTFISATPPANTTGSFKLRLKATSVKGGSSSDDNSPAANVDTDAIAVNNIVVVLTAAWSNTRFTDGKLQADLTFSGGRASGITISDFEVINASNQVQTGWTFDHPLYSTADGTPITIAVTPPSPINGTFRIRLKPTSVMGGGATTNNSPVSAVTSDSMFVGQLTWNQGPRLDVTSRTTDRRAGIFVTSTDHTQTVLDDKIYHLERDQLSQPAPRPGTIARFSRTGADDRAAEASQLLVAPPKPTGIGASYTFSYHNGLVIYNQKYYVGAIWQDGSNTQSSVEIYNTNGTHDSNLFVDTGITIGDLSVFGNKIYLWNTNTTGTNNRTFQVRNITNGTLLHTESTPTGALGVTAIAVSSQFIYVCVALTGNLWYVLVYDHSYNRATAYDTLTTYVGLGAVGAYPRYAAIDAGRMYVGTGRQANSFRRIHFYTNVVNPVKNIWETPTSDTARTIKAIFIRSAPDQAVTTANFEVQKLTGSTWATDSNWTITKSSDIVAESPWWTITATGNSNITTASYRIVLKQNAIGTHSAVPSPSYDLTVTAGPAVATAAWSLVSYCTTSNKLQGTLTFNNAVTGITASDFEIRNDSDVLQTGWTFDTPSATADANTGIAIAATAPSAINGSFKIRLKENSVLGPRSTTANSPASDVDTADTTVDNRPVVAVSTFALRSGSTTSASTATREFTLDFDRDIDANALTSADFTISNTAVTFNSISPTTGTEDTYTLTVNQPANARGDYTITLAANAVPAKDNAYKAGPASASTTASTSFDRRVAVSVSSRVLPTGTQTGATISGSITFSSPIPAAQLTNNDFTLTGGATLALASATGSNSTYNFTITQPTNGMGTYTVQLKASAVAESNTYLAGPSSIFTLGTVTYNTRRVITATWTEPTGTQTGATSDFTLTFGLSIPATQLSSTDFTVTDGGSVAATGAISPTTGSTTAYTITVTNPTSGSGTYTISLKANAIVDGTTYLAGPTSALASTAVAFDRRDRVSVSSDVLASGTQRGATTAGTITFDRAIPATELTGSDFTLTGGASIAVTETTGNHSTFNLVITQPTSGNGTYTVTLKANAISGTTQYLQGPLNSYLLGTITYDRRTAVAVSHFRPKLTTDAAESASTREFELDLDRDVTATELTQADFTISNTAVTWSSISPTTGDEDTYTITVNQPVDTSGSYTIQLRASAVSAKHNAYLAGPTSAQTSDSADFDTRSAISVDAHSLSTGEQTGSTISGSITFNKAVPVSEVTAADFTVTGGATLALGSATGNQATYNFTITQPTNAMGSYTVSFKANAISTGTTYLQGPTAVYSIGTVQYDTRSAITATWTEPTGTQTGATSDFTLTFNQSVPANQLANTDFTVTGGASIAATGAISPSTGSATSYTITVTQPTSGMGDYTVALKADAIATGTTYLEGPDNVVTSTAVSYDRRSRVNVTGDTLPSTTQTGATVAATITFDRPIPATELTAADFTLSSGSIAVTETTGSHSTFNLTITQPTTGNGTYTVSLNANAIPTGTGYLGGPLNAYSLGTVTYDRRTAVAVSHFRPKLTTDAAESASTREFELDFDRDITASELAQADFTISDSAITWSSISPTTGDEDTYTITVNQPANDHGDYTITLAANSVSAKNNAYLAGPANAFASASADFDTRTAVSVSSDTLPSTEQTGATVTGTITFDRAVPPIDTNDFTLSGGATIAITETTGTQATYNFTITQPTNSMGSYTVDLNMNAVSGTDTYLQGPTTAYRLGTVTYDTRSAITASWAEPTGVQTGATSQLTLTLNNTVPTAQITSADFTVSGGLSYTISPSTGNASTYTITVTHTANTDGDYTVTFAQNAVATASTYLQGPTSAVTSSSVDYDTRARVTVTGDTLPATEQTGNTVAATITFSRSIPATELTASDFTLSAGSIAITETSGNHQTFNLVITQPTTGNGTYTVSLNADAISDGTGYLGGPVNAYSLGTVTYDRRSAITVTSFTVVSSTPAAQKASTREFRLVLGSQVPATEITTSDFTASLSGVTIGSISPTSGNNTTYTVTVNQPANTENSYTVTFARNSISARNNAYLQGPSAASTTTSTSFDTRTAVGVTSFGLKSGSTSESTATREFELVFDRSVPASELVQGDFTISNSAVTWGSISGSGTTYTITVNQPENARGSYTITLAQNAIPTATTYLQGPTSAEVTSSTSFDRRTAVSVSSDTLPSTEQTGNTVTGTITFDRAVAPIDGNDFTLTGGATIAITETTGTQATYNFTITQPSGNGSYTVSLNANAVTATDTYKAGPTSAYSLGTVNYDRRPVVAVSHFRPVLTTTSAQKAATREFELDFDQDIDATALTRADFTISDSSVMFPADPANFITPTTGTENTYTLTVNQPANAHGDYTITLAANTIDAKDNAYKLSPTTASTTASTSFDRRGPITVDTFRVEGNANELQSNSVLPLSLVFDLPVDVTKLRESDFTLGGDPTTIASVDPLNVMNGFTASFRVNVNQPVGSGSYTIQLKANAIQDAGPTYKAGPMNAYPSNPLSIGYRDVVSTAFQAVWEPEDPDRELNYHAEADQSITTIIDINETVVAREDDDRFEVVDSANVPQTDWTITTSDPSSPVKVTATPTAPITPGNYRIRLKAMTFGTFPAAPIPSPVFAVAAQMAPPMVTVIPGGRPGVGFREAILRRIEKRICDHLVIESPEIRYQNDIQGYTNLYRLKYMGSNQQVMLDSPSRNLTYIDPKTDPNLSAFQTLTQYRENAYLAPRNPKPGYSTPLHALHCRPIKNFDVTGLRPVTSSPKMRNSNSRSKGDRFYSDTGGIDRYVDITPTAFLHIIDGEKDIYWPQRNRVAKARLDHQVEYMKIAIDCVFRNECVPDPAAEIMGNGMYWVTQTQSCLPIPDIPEIVLQNPAAMPMAMPPVTTYEPQYHRTINQQAVQFVQDIESLLDPEDMKVDQQSNNYRFGPASVEYPDGIYQAWVMNTNLAMWGMLPEAGNAPTDTVRCIFEFEVHYPKVYDLQTGTQGTD